MNKARVWDDIDVNFVVAGGDDDPESIRETIEIIKAMKARPEAAREAKEARELYAALKRDGLAGMGDPEALLEHWKQIAAELDSKASIAKGDPDPAV